MSYTNDTRSLVVKDASASHKNFEIARSHGILISDILEYDIFETNSLFDDRDYTQKPRKHELVNILEEHFMKEDKSFTMDSHSNTSLVVDFI